MMTLDQFDCLLRGTANGAIVQTMLVEEDVVARIKKNHIGEDGNFLASFYAMRIECLTETKAFFDSMVSYLTQNGLNKNTKAHILERIQAFETAKKNEWPLKYGEQVKGHIYTALVQFTEIFCK